MGGNSSPSLSCRHSKSHRRVRPTTPAAIALGFIDTFARKDRESQILWLDLLPEKSLSSSTREFLFRVTTPAHPWGYDREDRATTLGAAAIRCGLEKHGWDKPNSPIYKRPSPSCISPFNAIMPVPVAWLLDEYRKEPRGDFWERLLSRCRDRFHAWDESKEAAFFENREPRESFERGLECAFTLQIPALTVPSDAIRSNSKQEIAKGIEEQGEDVSHVGHLFQRINNAGTPISQDDLQYSIIKAYWPGIEATIGKINPMPMRPSRLALLGSRAALAKKGQSKNLPGGFNIARLRAIAEDKSEGKKEIETFFGLNETRDCETQLVKVTRKVDQWLLQSDENRDGLPAVLRTSIAHRSPEVYLLLQVLAARALEQNDQDESLNWPVIGLTTALHWFCSDQSRAVRTIYERLSGDKKFCRDDFSGILQQITDTVNNSRGLLPLLAPDELKSLIPEPSLTTLADWNWEQAIIGSNSETSQLQEKWQLKWPFVNKIRSDKELLIYFQRQRMFKEFSDYDPSNAEKWEDHDRPWDFDHLLPQSYFYDRRKWPFLRVCQAWGHTNGNFHILRFEENRSRSDTPANVSFKGADLELMGFSDQASLDAFSIQKDGSGNQVHVFVLAARQRLLNIYADWFTQLDLPFLLGQGNTLPSAESPESPGSTLET